MSLLGRRHLSWVTAVVCTGLVLFLWSSQPLADGVGPYAVATALSPKTWIFDHRRDSNNYGLSSEQCASAFPSLYNAIERSITALNGTKIAYADTVGGNHWSETRVMIYDNQLYVIDDWRNPISENRKFGTLHAIDRAINAVSGNGVQFPNIEFSMITGDKNPDQSRPNWAYDRLTTDQKTWLMPDFGLYTWPSHDVGSWQETRRKALEVERAYSTFKNKIPHLLWRGTMEFGKEVREALVAATRGKTWSAVEGIDWGAADYRNHTISQPEHCKYQFLAHTEGLAYSGRLKYLHNCESVIIAHTLEYETHDQYAMVDSGPMQNFVLVERDFSDLSTKMEWLLAHPEEAARIARNNVETFRDRYLTPAAEACYWRHMISAWASVAFEPSFYDTDEAEIAKWRGTPYESFSLMRGLDWNKQVAG